MKKIIILIPLFNIYLYSYDFYLNSNDMKIINNHINQNTILTRLKNFNDLKIKLQNLSLNQKLNFINTFFNKFPSNSDKFLYEIDDYWATPKEFIINGAGDCEDYVISKYFALLELGINKDYLYLVNVGLKNSDESHMILLYKDSTNSQALVLDNLNSKIIPFEKRKDLTPYAAFNENGFYNITHKYITFNSEINWEKEGKWENLLYRVHHLNE